MFYKTQFVGFLKDKLLAKSTWTKSFIHITIKQVWIACFFQHQSLHLTNLKHYAPVYMQAIKDVERNPKP
jgi:hypothetical protein